MKPVFKSMSSEQITNILRGQHSNDVFVPECKDGSTWFAGHARMDVWVMNRSWARLCFTGYEIKVSRGDFKQDEKWHSYLPLCNQLYFVCPKGMIEPSEMPDGVGLKYCTEARATTVKKAAHREVQPPMELFVYLLMCRSRIVEPNYHEPRTREEKVAEYKKWLAEKEEDRSIGHMVSYGIARTTDSVQHANKSLMAQIERFKKIEQFCRDIGINQYDYDDRIKDKLAQFKKLIPDDYLNKVRAIEQSTRELVSIIESHRA